MLLFIIELILLVVGIGCIMKAKMSFQYRQQKHPDNQWSDQEKKLRIIGFAVLGVDIILALFVKI